MAYSSNPQLMCVGVFAAAALVLPSQATAQRVFNGESCRTVTDTCIATSPSCEADSHVVLLGILCLCLPGTAPGDSTLCCSNDGDCPSGSTCLAATGSGGGLCSSPTTTYCHSPITPAQRDACFTTPDGRPQANWRLGDCDGDGVANEEEVRLGRDVCCNEGTDLACCLRSDDVVSCCSAIDPSSADSCCLAVDSPATCCGGSPMGCCTAASDPVACCVAAGGAPSECCLLAGSAASCCLSLGDPVSDCCAMAGAVDEFACNDAGMSGADAETSRDAGLGDASGELDGAAENRDAGAPVDASTMDGGATADGGTLSFGGGGGCTCSAHRRAPAPLGLLITGVLIALPAFRRRSRR